MTEAPRATAPRIFHVGPSGHAEDPGALAVDLGFTALGLAPFGPVDRPVRDHYAERADRSIQAAARAGLAAIIDLPWTVHAPMGRLPSEHPGWFDGQTRAGGAVADPRRSAPVEAQRLATHREDLRPAQIGWLAGLIAQLHAAGAAGVRLPALASAPAPFWTSLIERVRADQPDMLLIGDALGAPFSGLQALDRAGFDYFLDSVAWWDGTADWFLTQRDALATPGIGFARPPEDPHAGMASDALAAKTAQILLTSPGLLMPAALIDPDDDALGRNLRALNAWRAETAWLDSGGPLLRAGRKGLVRLAADARFAEEALAVAAAADRTALLSVTGGTFEPFTPVAELDGMDLLVARRRKTRAVRPPAQKQSLKRLEQLAAARIGIESVYPEIDGGRFAAKRIVGDTLEIAADILCDGHEAITACFWLTEPGDKQPVRYDMVHRGNDRWAGRAPLTKMGVATVSIEAWRDVYGTWKGELQKKRAAGQPIALELREGANLAKKALAAMADKPLSERERHLAQSLKTAVDAAGDDHDALAAALLNEGVPDLMHQHGLRVNLTRYDHDIPIQVDRRQARFSAWYEMFPRSQSGRADKHGTFDDVIARLAYVRDLGFDVLYFPPIHPIGKTNRKGRNNSLVARQDDPGSPYAIGSAEGGHDAIHPELGTLEDFRRLVAAAAEHGLEIALDFAIQCSPDHPWLKEHPEWFDWRPDGTIKFAENPPKKYEDIVNVHFYRDAIPSLWFALRDVVLFWCEQGVKLFRVDNPHTKPFPFWEWMIADVKQRFPDALFLSEAFTRPKVMKRLAKLGFTQSYTYYTWRNTKDELIAYVTELTKTDSREVMNPNFFINTPDINPKPLQSNNRAAYIARTVLAGTLASSYGLYNGVEICEGTPMPGKEEYLDSEKYQIRAWDMDRPGHIQEEIRWLNRLRRNHPALHNHVGIEFLTAWNEHILWYARFTPDLSDVLVFAVSLDFERPQAADCEIPLWLFGLADDAAIEAEDLISGSRIHWHGKIQHLSLSPEAIVAAYRLLPPEGALPVRDVTLYQDLRYGT
ncbi:MAG: maltotransferase domain-containing protein [Rhodothalassiaceae bacterium]